ncbi:hypothetical protein [Mycobacterium sp.]|uniref:hypothetical protein n=1 Tax=Mycobacterium sp. TaxID=1785 RepID=UPI003C70998E
MRAVLIVLGVAVGAYGAVLLLENPPVIIVRILIWAVVGAIVHDFVFAPSAAAMGFAGRRLIRGRWWTPVSVAGLCTAVLVLLAIPVYARPGARPDNLTVLDRNYPVGLWISLAVVWACVPVYFLLTRFLPVRQDDVVEHQSADDVGGQPPAV